MPSSPRSIPDVSNGAAPRACGWTAVAMVLLLPGCRSGQYASQPRRTATDVPNRPMSPPVPTRRTRPCGRTLRAATRPGTMTPRPGGGGMLINWRAAVAALLGMLALAAPASASTVSLGFELRYDAAPGEANDL